MRHTRNSTGNLFHDPLVILKVLASFFSNKHQGLFDIKTSVKPSLLRNWPSPIYLSTGGFSFFHMPSITDTIKYSVLSGGA